MLLATGTFLLLLSFVTSKGGLLVPTHWQSLIELIYEFVANLVQEQVRGLRWKRGHWCARSAVTMAHYQQAIFSRGLCSKMRDDRLVCRRG